MRDLELTPLQDGHAAFLVYDIYQLSNKPAISKATSLRAKPSDEFAALKRALMILVREAASSFPNGRGFLGFGLVHKYINLGSGSSSYESELKLLPEDLKGRDALLYSSFRDLGLDVRVTGHFIEENNDSGIFEALANTIEVSDMASEDTIQEAFEGGEAICVAAPDDYYGDKEGDPEVFKLVWVTPPTDLNILRIQYMYYYGGNDNMMVDMWGKACMVVKVHQN